MFPRLGFKSFLRGGGVGAGEWRQGPSHGARALQAKVIPLLHKTVLGTRARAGSVLPLPVCGCSRDGVVCFPAWQGRLESASISFPHAVSLGVGSGGGGVSEVRVLKGARGDPLPLPNICGQVFRREGLKSYPHCRLSRVLERQAGKHTDF